MTDFAHAIRRNSLSKAAWNTLEIAKKLEMDTTSRVVDAHMNSHLKSYPTLEEVVGLPVNKRASIPLIGMGHPGTTPFPTPTPPPG